MLFGQRGLAVDVGALEVLDNTPETEELTLDEVGASAGEEIPDVVLGTSELVDGTTLLIAGLVTTEEPCGVALPDAATLEELARPVLVTARVEDGTTDGVVDAVTDVFASMTRGELLTVVDVLFGAAESTSVDVFETSMKPAVMFDEDVVSGDQYVDVDVLFGAPESPSIDVLDSAVRASLIPGDVVVSGDQYVDDDVLSGTLGTSADVLPSAVRGVLLTSSAVDVSSVAVEVSTAEVEFSVGVVCT